MSNPAAHVGELLHNERSEVELMAKLVNGQLTPDEEVELLAKIVNGQLTPDEFDDYLRLSGKTTNYAVMDAISAVRGSYRDPVREIFTNNKNSESPDYNVSIYISTLWGVKKQSGGGGDKLNKTGDTMFGPLEMGGNRITGLSHDYPPVDSNDAVSWRQVGLRLDNYVPTSGSMITGMLGVGRGITIGNDAVKIMSRPIEDVDATNKEYVDSKKPIIAIWAASHGSIVNGKSEWYFGEKIRNDTQSGFMMPVRGKIIRGSLSIAYNSGAAIFDVNTDVVQVEVNGIGQYLQINTGVKIFDPLPINQGDIISFKSIVNIRQVASATVCVLIELDF